MNAERDEGRPWPVLEPGEPIGDPAPVGEFEVFQQAMLKSIAQHFSGTRAPSRTTAAVVLQVLERDAHGQRKYGVTLDRGDLSLSDWLQHMAEELMDGAHYAIAAKREFRQAVTEQSNRNFLELLERCCVAESKNADSTAGVTSAWKVLDRVKSELSK